MPYETTASLDCHRPWYFVKDRRNETQIDTNHIPQTVKVVHDNLTGRKFSTYIKLELLFS